MLIIRLNNKGFILFVAVHPWLSGRVPEVSKVAFLFPIVDKLYCIHQEFATS